MYGQADYGSQPPRASAYQQLPPVPPPPPHLQFQQGPRARPSPLIQPAAPPQINQSGPSLYQHGLPAPPPPVHPGPPSQISPLGAPIASESYRHPPPLVSQMHLSGQQAQHSHMGAQNMHHNPAIVPPSHGPNCPEMLQAPQPLGALPPPPLSQGQTSYRTSFFPPPPYPGGVQPLNHIPPPPPTIASSFFTPAVFGSSVQTIMGESQVSSVALPPPPSSTPPIQPSRPLSSNSLFSFSKPSAASSCDEAVALNQVRDDISVQASSQNSKDGCRSELKSQPRDVSSLKSEILNLPPPPLKPTNAKTTQRIEDLCQLIAKNGPGVEDVTRQREYGNPEYEFLFGGDPGSEAAIGCAYFLWLKKKSLLEHKFHEEQGEPTLTPLQMDSLSEPNVSITSAGCTSTVDSDMEMEDDITLFDKDQDMNHSTEALLNIEEHHVKEQLHTTKLSPDCSPVQEISSEKLSCGSLLEKNERLSSKYALTVHSQVAASGGATECSLDSDLEKTISHLPDNLNPSGASVASEDVNSKKHSEVITGRSPIRLLQDYASDDSSENDDELLHKDINPSAVLPSLIADASSPHRDNVRCVETDMVSKSQQSDEKTKKGSRWLSKTNPSQKAADCALVSHGEVKAASGSSVTTGRTDGYVDSYPGKQSSIKDAFCHVDVQKKVALDDADGHISKRGKTERENEEKRAKSESTSLKVDEFGRLVKEGSSDSESDSGYTHRHEKRGKRGRNPSRSRSPSRNRSPLDRRRTRRGSWRRKEKRSRSRSWSPRNRRSRSRSPTYRRAGEFRGEKLRLDRSHIPPCFDFIRGRCIRGAKCRYMHDEVDKSNTSRHHMSKQKYPEVSSGAKNNKTKKENNNASVKPPEHVGGEAHNQEMQGGKVDWKKENIHMISQISIAWDHGRRFDSGMVKCQSPREIAGTVQEKQIIQEGSTEPNLQIPDNKTFGEQSHQPPPVDSFRSQFVDGGDVQNSFGDTSREDLPLVKDSAIHQPLSHISVTEDQNGNCPSHEMESSMSDASPNQRTLTSPKFSNSESVPSNILPPPSLPNASSSQALSSEPVQFPAPKELSPLSYSAPAIPQQSLQLPPPPPLPHTHSVNAPHMPQFPMGYGSIPQIASYPLQPTHVGNPQTYQASVASQHPQFSVPVNSSWTSLPPPPPQLSYDLHFNTETATGHFPPRNDFGFQISARRHSSELNSNSLHQAYPSIPRQPNFNLQIESSRSGNSISQFGAPSLLIDNRFGYPPIQDLNTSSSLGHSSLHQQPVPSSQELSANTMLPFSSNVVKSSSEIQPFSQKQLASGQLQNPLGDSSLSVPGKPGSISQYPPDFLDRNQSSSNADFLVPRISAHYNPYASTFEQPLSSKFSSSTFSQDKGAFSANQHDTPAGITQATSSPRSAKAVGQILPGAGDNQYDPLFDSIDPSSNARRKGDHDRKFEPVSESDPMERHGDSYKLDFEENNRHEVGAVASTTSLDNDEFGETADAEVGSVENESPSKPVDVATGGEMGTEMKSPWKKEKKMKDSRSTKPFKIAIADFVKDVLKPSWRQGNMSKEAFKTIVKKTVDKVSGAMKGHQMPKSQAKINQYIDSQQRKLTKLVMGYVDKYVKV